MKTAESVLEFILEASSSFWLQSVKSSGLDVFNSVLDVVITGWNVGIPGAIAVTIDLDAVISCGNKLLKLGLKKLTHENDEVF